MWRAWGEEEEEEEWSSDGGCAPVLQTAFKAMGISKVVNVVVLTGGSYQENLEFTQWLKGVGEKIVDNCSLKIAQRTTIRTCRRATCTMLWVAGLVKPVWHTEAALLFRPLFLLLRILRQRPLPSPSLCACRSPRRRLLQRRWHVLRLQPPAPRRLKKCYERVRSTTAAAATLHRRWAVRAAHPL